jgi:radical SAM superfamily enzyme YgiQ (UPF0313 family)
LFGSPRFASALFSGLRGMGRVWQAAGTVRAILQPGLVEQAAACGLRSLFVGFETLTPANLQAQHKNHNLSLDYAKAIDKLHNLGIMVNASFVFGLDEDDDSVFDCTVEWAVDQGIETATFHILTPYPGTALYDRMQAEGRLTCHDYNRYDTRHVVFRPARLSPEALEAGYWRAYRQFYAWQAIFEAAGTHPDLGSRLRHLAYTGAWKKAEPLWDWVIRQGWLPNFRLALERVLEGVPGHPSSHPAIQAALTAREEHAGEI